MSSTFVTELIEGCVSRRAEPWQELLARFGASLESGLSRGLRRCNARQAAEWREDLRQEVYCRLLEHDARALRRCRGRHEREVGAYLARIAERVVFDALRGEAAAKRGGPTGRRVRREDALEGALWCGPSPERRAELAEAGGRLVAVCRHAAGRRRTARRDLAILYLALFEDWTSPEICRRLGGGLTESAVDSVIHRGRRRLAAAGLAVPGRRAARGAGARRRARHAAPGRASCGARARRTAGGAAAERGEPREPN